MKIKLNQIKLTKLQLTFERDVIVVDSEGSGSGSETGTTVTLRLGPDSSNNSNNSNNNSNNNLGKPSGAFLAELNGSVASR